MNECPSLHWLIDTIPAWLVGDATSIEITESSRADKQTVYVTVTN